MDTTSFSRRGLLQGSGAVVAVASLGTLGACATTGGEVIGPRPPITDPAEALQRLQRGNQRYTSGNVERFRLDVARRMELTQGQAPLATVFACVDSRVPVERVFDQTHGDVLVVRTAAHVVDEVALGSIEFGVAKLKTPLVVVMGHHSCGAVAATIDLAGSDARAPGSIQAVVEGIAPSVEAARNEPGDLLRNATRLHSKRVADRLGQSPVIGEALQAGKVRVVAAYYDMETGAVEFLGS
jgi:carbonic anhydrase